ncbi:20721_t:CDS:2 [Dentiscutata erythropus]|uniref:ATP-dependent RNA helicase n=1 Tax=Dentiscutata erythropus TaxID=1348616 RepID=A0A9N9FMJ5_9GLOM|nr:20721_t:CDS:2 [Dentiscutata erythropus]
MFRPYSSIQEKESRFDEITAILPKTQRALREEFKYVTMSKVQNAVLSQAPIEGDLFVKAKTGTGKTLAFLIPAIETMHRKSLPKSDGRMVSVMILSPTRELAQQIATEAERLTRFYGYRVHCLVGGERRDAQIRRLMRHRVDIVVGTPGRVEDLLSSLPHFNRQCMEIKTLILDEADQLLDMGFREDIERIIQYYPKDRQTFLFSATVSPQIRQIAKFALKSEYTFIDTVDPNDVNTNVQVKQTYAIIPYHFHLIAIRKIINDHMKQHKNGKIMIFLPTKMSTILYADFLRNVGDIEVFELHSGKTQEQRTKVSNRFRQSRHDAVLVTSDVSARGVDYPGVTLVVQVGAPSSRDQYIHRLGRTGRAGKEGEGILLLAPFEKGFINCIDDLPIKLIEGINSDLEKSTDSRVEKAIEMLDGSIVKSACMAFLGYYSGKMSSYFIRKDDLLDSAYELGKAFGTEPNISPGLLSRIGFGGGNNGPRGRSWGGRSYDDRNYGRDRYEDRNQGRDRYEDRNYGYFSKVGKKKLFVNKSKGSAKNQLIF